MIHSVLGV